jgi:2-iminobutanoate/2-iminopropanoate deaminase
MQRYLLGFLLLAATGIRAQVRPVEVPGRAKPMCTACSAGMDAGDYVYISGQGASRPDGNIPGKFEEQARQALENVKAVVEASGLTMEHVVYVQVYLEDVGNYQELNGVFAKYFPRSPPARAVLGVSRLPQPAIEINAVAVRDLAGHKAVFPPNYKSDEPFSPGILTHDRLFVSAMLGRDPLTN